MPKNIRREEPNIWQGGRIDDRDGIYRSKVVSPKYIL